MQWSRNAVYVIDNRVLNTTRNIPMVEEFDFREERLYMNQNRYDKRNQSLHEHVGGEESSIQINGERVHACANCSVSRVDGLSPSIPKRKYSMTKRVAKENGERRIRFSRA